ncbi:nucleoside deaminase [Clostridium sp. MSJ-11]|uniref:tRNA-specific adenosine deaminase n=1 Tax=Clostridium mobile TaxID=2841512 RepID=A0ABS6EMR2_9CLOT|nr:nucleoside deaminase [Clostridium mobile]MBU5486516.1 nucleoside deaminase [Clostridium mobile]
MSEFFMHYALEEARKAKKLGEVPVGAVIVKDDVIIGKGHNMIETLKDSTAHAEMIAIKNASNFLGNWRLNGCEMYVTLEPCPMCAGAIIHSRLKGVYIGTFEPNAGACGSAINILQNRYLKTYVDVKWLYMEECSILLEDFFKSKRIN